MSQASEQNINQTIKLLFDNKKLTGYQIAKNNQVATIVKRDSTDFANEVIHHQRGRQIICQLIDIVLRPNTIHNNQNIENSVQNAKKMQTKSFFKANQTSSIIYNSIEILTNQYQEFVQYVFEQDKKQNKTPDYQLDSPTFPEIKIYSSSNEAEMNENKNKQNFNSKENQKQDKKQVQQQQDWDNCVIMDGRFPELTKNDQDSVLKKISDISKLSQSDSLKCSILDRMFLLFDEPQQIQQTPVSYFNKIILQFVYQRPEQIMRFFYCDKQNKSKQIKLKQSTGSLNRNCQKIRKICKHFYNNSIVELIVHIMELQNEGNFFIQQKIQIMKIIVQEIFRNDHLGYKNAPTQNASQFQQVSTVSDLVESKIKNYVSLLKCLFQKLQDRYEQEKFLPIFKSHLNDEQLLQRIISYFFFNFNYFDMSSLLNVLIQTLKMDQTNFRIHKLNSQNSNPFGQQNNLSFNNQNSQSQISSYDLKLSSSILDLIQKAITKISTKFQQWEGSTIRMVQYYELIHTWLNIVIKERQDYIKTNLFTPVFINQSLYKIQSHPNSTILHNSIKNIFVDFLPKINQSIKIIFTPECQLLSFIERYLQWPTKKEKKKKKKCFQNQLYHIAKTILSVWQQYKMLTTIKKTQDDEENQSQRLPSEYPTSPTSNQQFIIKLASLEQIIAKKQQFYDHLICGDPRKMGQYQQEQSSEIIMTSSLKNYFKPDFGAKFEVNQGVSKNMSNRYGQETDLGQKPKIEIKKQKQDQNDKKQANQKQNKFRNLRLGEEATTTSIFQSVISPLNANRSHVLNIDFDVLPLDSDNSEQVVSQQEDGPIKDEIESLDNINEDQIKLMQQNIQNMNILTGEILRVESIILSSNHPISNVKNLLNCDTYRKDQLSKSMDIPESQIQKVDSYLQVYSPRKQSEEDAFSLGLDSKQSGSKLSEQNKCSKNQNMMSILQQSESMKDIKKGDENEIETLDSQFVKFYVQYLQYDINKLCQEVQLN